MSAQIDLKDLTSFFELFVAYTFAYNNLNSVKEGVNKASVKNLDEKVDEYEKTFKSESEKVLDISVADQNIDLSGVTAGKLEDLNQTISDFKTIKQVTYVIYSGDFLRPVFYLTGAIYLFYILLSAFQNFVGDLTVLLIIDSITFCTWIFYIYYYINYIKPYTKGDFKNLNWEFPTKRTLKHFSVLASIVVVLSIIYSSYLHENYPQIGIYNDRKLANFCFFSKIDIYNFLSVCGVLSLSIIPFSVFYYREKMLNLTKVDENAKSLTGKIENTLNQIKVLSNVQLEIFNNNMVKVTKSKVTQAKPFPAARKLKTKKG